MENLNAEQIKKALECCAKEWNCGLCRFTKEECGLIKRNTLTLITSQEQRIGAQDMTISELRKRVEKAEHDADRYEQRIKELTEENERMHKSYYELACEVEDLRAEKKAAIEDLEHCMYFAKPKRPNTCNFCTHDCEVSKDGTRCKGKEDWIYCSPVWRGVVKSKSEGE